MRMLVLGAGRMGLGAVHDLVSQSDVTEVTVADYELSKAEAIAARYGKARAAQIDCNDHAAVVALMRGHASAISCVNYWLNERLARAAIEAGTNFCDLGGNNDVVDAELALDGEARAAGVNVIPDCGLAPGMVAVLVAHGAEQFPELDSIHIRVGGLPQTPKPPLDYQMVFSVEGLINEYIEPARVIREGKITTVESMTEIESLSFDEPQFSKMEAFQTSGGTSTLPETFLGRVRDLDYKTIRYPGHCAKFKTMIDLGLCSSEAITVDGAPVKPRRVLGDLLVKNLPHDEPDVVLVRVEFAGGGKRLRYDIIDRFDPETGLSAMMRTTAFPASIVALMMARNQTSSKGALPQERCIPPQLFMDELAKRKIDVRIS
jgi:lysine 6-dehydrogenase